MNTVSTPKPLKRDEISTWVEIDFNEWVFWDRLRLSWNVLMRATIRLPNITWRYHEKTLS